MTSPTPPQPNTGDKRLRKKFRAILAKWNFEDPAVGHIAAEEAISEIILVVKAELGAALIAEINRKMTLHVELLSSKDFKAGFSEALDQIDDVNAIRISELRNHFGIGAEQA